MALLSWFLDFSKAFPDDLGFLTQYLNDTDPKPAREQFDAHYQHGGGWHPFPGFRLNPNNSLSYPGDPPLDPIGGARLRDELILVYKCAWVAIIQPDRSFEVCRMD